MNNVETMCAECECIISCGTYPMCLTCNRCIASKEDAIRIANEFYSNTPYKITLRDDTPERELSDWTEEDDKKVQTLIDLLNYIETVFDVHGKFDDYVSWLKNIKYINNVKSIEDLPHWHKITIPNHDVTGFNSENFTYKGYLINYLDLFDKLPKED